MSKKSLILSLILSTLILVPTTFAASSTFLQQATKWYQSNCTGRNVSRSNSIGCYLFDKVDEIQKALDSLKNRVDGIETDVSYLDDRLIPAEAKINDLEQRLVLLEQASTSATPAPTPSPFEVTFFQGNVGTTGAASQTVDAHGYTRVMFTFQCTVGEADIALQVSNDQVTWVNQVSRGPTDCKNGGNADLTPAGRYYRAVVGSTTNPSLSVNALGWFGYQ